MTDCIREDGRLAQGIKALHAGFPERSAPTGKQGQALLAHLRPFLTLCLPTDTLSLGIATPLASASRHKLLHEGYFELVHVTKFWMHSKRRLEASDRVIRGSTI